MLFFEGNAKPGNVLLACDADGTLLTDDKRVLDKDKGAIRELCGMGGLFTIATGRGVTYTRPLAMELGLEIPAVIFNGAALYDFTHDRFLWQRTLPNTAVGRLLLFKEKFPTIGIEILRENEVYVVSTNAREEAHILLSDTPPTRCSVEDVPQDGWIKILIADEPDVIDEIAEFAGGLRADDIHMVRSAAIYYELLPFGVNKGIALSKLVDLMGAGGRCVVAAGDYFNDLEMLQMADIKVAVANAEDAVKAQADLIVCDNNSGPVHEIVEWLKRQSL